jgi:hypothetical protein
VTDHDHDTSNDYASRIAAIRQHPLCRRTMNQPQFGDEGVALDVSVEPGWLTLVEGVLAALSDLPLPPDFGVRQIKEKFGELKFYTTHGGLPSVRAIIDPAAAAASHTCQFCGCRGSVRVISGWWSTLCDVHADWSEKQHGWEGAPPGRDDNDDDGNGYDPATIHLLDGMPVIDRPGNHIMEPDMTIELAYDRLPRVPVTRFRRELNSWMRRMQRRDHGPIVLTRKGHDCVVCIPSWLYEQLGGRGQY